MGVASGSSVALVPGQVLSTRFPAWGRFLSQSPSDAQGPWFFHLKLRHTGPSVFTAACKLFVVAVGSGSPTRDGTWAPLHWEC